MEIGIVGLPNVGKSTVFKALTGLQVEIAGYTFTTVDSNIGTTEVPDNTLTEIGRVVQAEKIIPTHIKFVDIAGLVKNASKGEGLGNQFLGNIRDVNVIIHLVRCFKDKNVAHIEETIDPIRDIEIIELELSLADLDSIAKRRQKFKRQLKSGEKDSLKKLNFLEKLEARLQEGKNLGGVCLNDEEEKFLRDMNLLRAKSTILVANIDEKDLPEGGICNKSIEKAANERGLPSIFLAAKFEADLSELKDEDKREFLIDAGLESSSLVNLIGVTYKKLNLITFYTIESNQTKAWSLKRGESILEAAGKIHTDMKKGFVKAEVVQSDDLISDGSFSMARQKGHLKIEGREYIVQDGDVILIKFSK